MVSISLSSDRAIRRRWSSTFAETDAGPRLVAVDPFRWQHAFHNFNTFIVPLAAGLFLPWTTLMFVLVAPNGTIQPGGIFWIAIFFVFDLLSYGSSGYTNRDRFGVPPTTV